MSGIGVVIVTYNSADHIGGCLDAAMRAGGDVVVVDNASSDGTIAEVARRGVKLIANATNRGFAAAANQGFAVLNYDCVLLLNPDAVIESGLQALCEACARPNVAAAGGKLVDSDGRAQIGFLVRRLPTAAMLIAESLGVNRLWPGGPINRRYRALDLDYSKEQNVEQPAGAMLMVQRTIWHELGGFDEGFHPLWFEDVDFCKRAIGRGYTLRYVPEAVAKHTGGHSIPKLPVEIRRFYWYRSLLRYSAKHFGPVAFRAVCAAVVAGSILRAIAEAASGWSLKPMAEYRKVVRLAGRNLICGWPGDSVV